ncbi:MAG: response regulator transcription factor [Selenomonas sp.]|uniref:response regulator transcription factor n=1 Tax=Selenomonas sp. TaxID=2053611 RepID=UPI0025F72E6D|nr:response regulator transcription factor [Selenomonas sp.]MCI6085026.1 response regulator transcription factor [Selenomonas sp.]
MKRIFVVEDDSAIRELETDYLEAAGFAVETAGDGRTGRDRALAEDFDLLVLDIMLPFVDGFTICQAVRKEKDVPILFVTAKQEDSDKIRGLGYGADDYIVKPFSPAEFVARVKAHLARYERLTGEKERRHKSLVFGLLEILPEEHRVYRGGEEISLTRREFELLLFFAENPGIVFSMDTLFEKVWGLDAIGDTATVRVHVNRLREKIEPEPAKPIYVETVWGAGYRFKG